MSIHVHVYCILIIKIFHLLQNEDLILHTHTHTVHATLQLHLHLGLPPQEAGADAVLEMAFTIADGLEYCRTGKNIPQYIQL